MKTATSEAIRRIDRLNEGDWLRQLLADVQRQVATRPSAQAVERIRQRLVAEISTPARAAA